MQPKLTSYSNKKIKEHTHTYTHTHTHTQYTGICATSNKSAVTKLLFASTRIDRRKTLYVQGDS